VLQDPLDHSCLAPDGSVVQTGGTHFRDEKGRDILVGDEVVEGGCLAMSGGVVEAAGILSVFDRFDFGLAERLEGGVERAEIA